MKVLLVRGHQATPWELRPWERLSGDVEVRLLMTAVQPLRRGERRARARPSAVAAGLLRAGGSAISPPRSRATATSAARRRSSGPTSSTPRSSADWFAAEAAAPRRARPSGSCRPCGRRSRCSTPTGPPARGAPRAVLAATDLFLAATERAARRCCSRACPPAHRGLPRPGIDVGRFAARARRRRRGEHGIVLSPGAPRLGEGPPGRDPRARARCAAGSSTARGAAASRAGSSSAPGPRRRCSAHARELGIGDAVESRARPLRRDAVRVRRGVLHGAREPAERDDGAARAGRRARSGRSSSGWCSPRRWRPGSRSSPPAARSPRSRGRARRPTWRPGDWRGLARALAEGPLSAPPGRRVEHDRARLEAWSVDAAAARLEAAYRRVLAR